MPSYCEKKNLPYNFQDLFEMVLDVEKYPDFLPWCRASRILEKGESDFLAELVISFSAFTESYVSRVSHNVALDSASIQVSLVRGPFSSLNNSWIFSKVDDKNTEIDFCVDFKFKSKLLEKLIGGVFAKATFKMVSAFEMRAKELYGQA
jgi:coenzyme Q-binding protein COQ10